MISNFFIERPRFAFVVSIVITLAGFISLLAMPVAQYPDITPSQVSVSTTYPGADARTVLETVIQPLETQINGVKKMLYLSSTATDTGTANITVSFAIGSDGDVNTVNTQNRVNWASAQLPEEVRRQSVIVKEKSSNMLQVFAIYSPNGAYDSLFLNNYASINIKDELARIPGVSDVQILGEQKYAMRIWLDTDRMAHLKIGVEDVQSAIKKQNVQVSAGALGEAPTDGDQVFRYSLQTQGRMTDVTEFENIIVRATAEGEQVRVKDIARVELGSESYASTGTFDGKPAALLAIYQLSDANGLEISKQAKAKLEELKAYFPEDLACAVAFDTTDFISASLQEVVVTLIFAVVLVVLVTYLFLQDWRATLVPTAAIPVSLIGTFAVLHLAGFSINLISLFGLILAIGIVVDDAIVVIENISRLIETENLSPKAAAIRSMEEVTGPVIATTLVLLAMFTPVCFLPGITGEMYRQFGITIAVAVSISSINALTLSPALSAMIMKPKAQKRPIFFIGGFFRVFNFIFDKITVGYARIAAPVIRHAFLMLVFYGVLTVFAVRLYNQIPTGFIPDEDQGMIYVNIQLPEAASLPRSLEVTDRLVAIALKEPGVRHVIAVPGYSILTSSQSSNNSLLVISLQPWDERREALLHQGAILARFMEKFRRVPEAAVNAFGMPAISGIGTTGGFSFVIEDTTGVDPVRLQSAVDAVVAAARRRPELMQVFSTFSARTPQVFLNIDREKSLKMGVSLDSLNAALQGFTGYTYVNDFNRFGKVYKVEMQADQDFRSGVEDLKRFYIRNHTGEMVPLSTMVAVEQKLVPQYLTRYNLYTSAVINGVNAPGYSSGDAMKAMEEIARAELPAGMKFDWTDMSYQEREAGKSFRFAGLEIAMMAGIFALALSFMYLFLVAQYESWLLPVAVLLAVPVAFLGSLLALRFTGIENNIYTQVGFVLLFGIACKTAILIVEFAKIKHDEGLGVFEAALFAARLRFRAVLMTALSFLLGILPLVVAVGAGAAGRRALGTAVFGGMLLAVVVGTVLIPAFYVVVQTIINRCSKKS
jgi:HAE1 family hydrophobic/amphiphilic exporter-1